LKSRSVSSELAISQSLAAFQWLQAQNATQILFKYCSTFDSTPQGNIGPVAETLAEKLGTEGVVVCPAFPTTGRTIYNGHLFVGDKLLNESGLENHPLNPMTDADLRRWLQQQCNSNVGHVAHSTVLAGAQAVCDALRSAADNKQTLVIVDAITDDDLLTIGRACANAKLITGGSGIALGLPENFRQQGLLGDHSNSFHPQTGPAAILAGSCSTATREQIAAYNLGPKIELDIEQLMAGKLSVDNVMAELPKGDSPSPLIYSSSSPESVNTNQTIHGTTKVASTIEQFFADLAQALVAANYKRLVVAGGETSGAVVSALNINAFDIGPEIDPGVPALSATGGSTTTSTIAMALKSGNFGGVDFFANALTSLETAT